MDPSKVNILLFFFVANAFLNCVCLKIPQKNPLTKIPLEDRITFYGYPVELYSITTQDGYILSLYRIPRPNNIKIDSPQRSPVLLVHGMGGSPGNYFVMRNESLALYLVDRGFDVWVMCCRGVKCSHVPMHVNMDWDNQNYWKYTLHEIALNDIPPTINFILNKTAQEKVFIVGHSAGNTVQFILLSELPEFNKKVKIAVALAPTVFVNFSDDPVLQMLASLVNLGKGLFFNILGNYEGSPKFAVEMVMEMARKACQDQAFYKVCIKFASIIGSHSSLLVDYQQIFPLMLADASYRVSAMELFQYAQIINSGSFAKYDYGKRKNIKLYGQKIPPIYNLTKITTTMALFYAQHDSIVTIKSVRKLKKYLPKLITSYMVPFKKFTHTDFIFAHNASKLVYQPLAKMFTDFDEKEKLMLN